MSGLVLISAAHSRFVYLLTVVVGLVGIAVIDGGVLRLVKPVLRGASDAWRRRGGGRRLPVARARLIARR
jgi:hypothetical protein